MSSFRIFLLSLSLLFAAGATPRAFAVSQNQEKQDPGQIPSPPRVQIPNSPVAETQKQLDDIIQVHKTLQLQHQQEILEIQRILGQARAHQRLLKELAEEKGISGGAPSSVTRLDVEQAIRSQKIKLIKEQTEKNRAAIEDLEKQAVEKEEKKS